MGKREDSFWVYSGALGYDKCVRVYLPKSYSKDSRKRYPVLYMHDGQNIVRKADLSGQSWDVTKTLARLGKEIIVVGIDCSPNRSQEYCPHSLETGEPRVRNISDSLSEEYLDFIVSYLKPLIDFRYRTLPGKDFTYMAGSSLGALITAYCALVHKGVFGKFGIFSLAYSMIGRQFESDFRSLGTDLEAIYCLYVGDNEGDGGLSGDLFLNDYRCYAELLKASGARLEDAAIFAGHGHRERYWAEQFARFAEHL